MEKLLLACLFMTIALLFIMLGMAGGFDFCWPVHGVDHNGREEPFTIYIGFCAGSY